MRFDSETGALGCHVLPLKRGCRMGEMMENVARVKSLRPLVAAAALVVTLSLLLAGNVASQETVNLGSHIPPFANIDGGEYLRLRAEHIARLRGLPYAMRCASVQFKSFSKSSNSGPRAHPS